MVVVLYALGMLELALGFVFVVGVLSAEPGNEWMSAVFAVLMIVLPAIGLLTMAAGRILDTVLALRRNTDQRLSAGALGSMPEENMRAG